IVVRKLMDGAMLKDSSKLTKAKVSAAVMLGLHDSRGCEPMRRKLPSTQTLACFEAAARHRSLTRAAQELALTQGAVSRQLGQLEEFLGVKLFRRAQHGIALTPAGEDYARKVSVRLDAIERDALDLM